MFVIGKNPPEFLKTPEFSGVVLCECRICRYWGFRRGVRFSETILPSMIGSTCNVEERTLYTCIQICGIYTAYRSKTVPRKNLGGLGNILKKKCFTDRNKKRMDRYKLKIYILR